MYSSTTSKHDNSWIGPGDEVIVPALTFCASANAIIHAGATPILADVNPQTMNIDPNDIDKGKTGIDRDSFLGGMSKQNIGVGVHYLSIPEHPYYQARFGWKPEDYPNAMQIGRQTVSLPLSAKLSNEDTKDIIRAAENSLKAY